MGAGGCRGGANGTDTPYYGDKVMTNAQAYANCTADANCIGYANNRSAWPVQGHAHAVTTRFYCKVTSSLCTNVGTSASAMSLITGVAMAGGPVANSWCFAKKPVCSPPTLSANHASFGTCDASKSMAAGSFCQLVCKANGYVSSGPTYCNPDGTRTDSTCIANGTHDIFVSWRSDRAGK